jgi:hypothetical protein
MMQLGRPIKVSMLQPMISPNHLNHFPKNVKKPNIFAIALNGSSVLNPSTRLSSNDEIITADNINTSIIERVVNDIILYR